MSGREPDEGNTAVGTSASHRSPHSDASWQAVRALYDVGAPPALVAGALARALPEAFLDRVADPSLCARALSAMEAGSEVLADPTGVAWAGLESLEAELARTAGLRVMLGASPTPPPAELTRAFAAEYAGAIAEHAVARDLEEYVGSPSLPDVGALSRLVEAVGDEARREVLALPLAPPAGTTESERPADVAARLVLDAFAGLRGRDVPDA
jgi:hypothetical protein